MARPIKETPILKGQEARVFIQKMNNVSERKISSDEVIRMKSNYERMRSISKF